MKKAMESIIAMGHLKVQTLKEEREGCILYKMVEKVEAGEICHALRSTWEFMLVAWLLVVLCCTTDKTPSSDTLGNVFH
jgi:hypothetical protein